MNPSLFQVAAFIRQHTHNLRNELSGIELEAVLLTTLFPKGEAAETVARLRGQIRKVVADLRDLSQRFAEPKLIRVPMVARELFGMWGKQVEPDGPKISWTESLGEVRVNVDVTSLAGVFKELLSNAVDFGSGAQLAAAGIVDAGQAVFSLREPKTGPVAPSEWGRAPFVSTKRGGYGLGLWVADRVVQANGGSVSRAYEDGHLITKLSFPAE